MDEPTKIIETSLEVNYSNNNDASSTTSRLSQYKQIGKLSCTLDDRRRAVLAGQKQRRDEVFSKFRGLLEELHIKDDQMEWSQVLGKRESKINKIARNFVKQLMFSEWLSDIPCDLEANWLVKPCPVGQRTLLVVGRGKTISYFKNGGVRSFLHSYLPGGSKEDVERKVKSNYVVLDCIYNSDNDTHYVLDVLDWCNFVTLSSPAELRFFWVKSKFEELLLEYADASDGKYAKIVPLPHLLVSQLPMFMSDFPVFSDNRPELDGLLFYHKLASYEPGRTPLVGWIKPFMLPEKLNVPVNEAYLYGQDPENVLQLMEKENQRYYSTQNSCRKKSHRKRNQVINMEEDEPIQDEEDSMLIS